MIARKRRRWLRWSARLLGGFLALLVALAWLSTSHFKAFGGAPSPASRARIDASPHFHDGRFQNLDPTTMMAEGSIKSSLGDWLFGKEMRSPVCALPLFGDTAKALRTPALSGLRITWLGHSTTLIEIDGAVILTDPMWSERASPSRWVGPKRFHPPPLALEDLPHLDAVLVSHEHYDHLDMATVQALAARGVEFHVPLGIGGHLAAWGVAEDKIIEHDWWEDKTLPGGLKIVSTPSRHFNGRGVPSRVGALWTSWSLIGDKHRAFFSGDTGLSEVFREIAAKEGPFDVALLEIGQYHPSWGDIHLGPKGALEAFERLGAKALVPIHWSTFQLAYHAWSEPAETLTTLAEQRHVALLTPRLGEPIEPSLSTTTPWWRPLPPMTSACP